MAHLERADLFATPIWTAQLSAFEAHLEEMASVARRVLMEHPTHEDDPLHQSRAVMQEVDDERWRAFFAVLASLMETITGRELPPGYAFGEGILRSWVLEIADEAEWRRTSSTLVALHSHLPAVLSSVFYVEVPPELRGRTSGGTTFKDPNSAVTGAYRRPSEHVSAHPGRLVIFPSWLEHMPEPPASAVHLSGARLIVATDLLLSPA